METKNGDLEGLLPSERARFDEVCRFGQERLEPIAGTIAAAFADDPIWMWLHGATESLALDAALPLARMLVSARSGADEIHGFRDYGAVALWTAPVGVPTSAGGPAHRAEAGDPPAGGADRDGTSRRKQHFAAWADVMGERLALAGELEHAMKAMRPPEPHWYLGILATRPDRQNQGLGSRVLSVMHHRCDRLGIASFLESSNPRNYGFYRRHGYVETGPATPADAPPLMGFVRRPR